MQEDIVRKSNEIVIYSQDGDNTINILDPFTYNTTHKYQLQDKNGLTCNSLLISQLYGHLLFCQNNSSFIVQMDLLQQRNQRKSSNSEQISQLILNEYENILVGGSMNGNVYIWSTIQGILLGQYKVFSKKVTRMRWYNGNMVMASSEDGTIKKLSIESCIQMNQFTEHQLQSDNTNSMIIMSLNGHIGKVIDFDIALNIMVSIGVDKNMIVWNLESKLKIDNVVLNSLANVVKFSNDQMHVYVGCNDHKIYRYSLYGQQQPEVLEGHQSAVNQLGFYHEQNVLVSGSVAGEIVFWNHDKVKKSIKLQKKSSISNLLVVQRPIQFHRQDNLVQQKQQIGFNTLKKQFSYGADQKGKLKLLSRKSRKIDKIRQEYTRRQYWTGIQKEQKDEVEAGNGNSHQEVDYTQIEL